MAVFWNDLDDFLVNLFQTEMGVNGNYTTLKAVTVNKRIYANQMEWPYWNLPAISVACHTIRYGTGEHGVGAGKRYARTYQCIAVGLVSGLSGTTGENIKDFYERMELVIRIQPVTVSVNGVITRGTTTITQGYVTEQMYTDDSTGSEKRIGIANIRFEVEAKG